MPLAGSASPLPEEETPQARAARGEAFEVWSAAEGSDGVPRRFEAKGRPIDGETAGGGVIVIRRIPEG